MRSSTRLACCIALPLVLFAVDRPAATLQAAQGCDRPTIIRIETQGSHGYRPTDKIIAQAADIWAFAAANLALPVPATPIQP